MLPLVLPVLLAASPAPTTEAGVQVRPRAEATKEAPEPVVTQRTRAWVEHTRGKVKARVTGEDVRAWAGSSKQEIHEGWLQLGEDAMFLRVGRQELNLDGQRLVGAVNWSQDGRSFEGLRLGGKSGETVWNLLGARLPTHDTLIGHVAHTTSGIRIGVPVIYDSDRLVQTKKDADQMDRVTGGVHVSSKKGDLKWRVEGYGQLEEDRANDVSKKAFMVGARAGYKVSAAVMPTLWVDYLSGDDTFNTLYATNHKFYGYMDKFLNIPVHTANGGLIDIALKNEGKVGPGVLALAIHDFMRAAEDANGTSGQVAIEADVTYAVKVHPGAKLVGGVAAWIPQGDFDEMDKEAWGFLMLDVQLSSK